MSRQSPVAYPCSSIVQTLTPCVEQILFINCADAYTMREPRGFTWTIPGTIKVDYYNCMDKTLGNLYRNALHWSRNVGKNMKQGKP